MSDETWTAFLLICEWETPTRMVFMAADQVIKNEIEQYVALTTAAQLTAKPPSRMENEAFGQSK